MGGAPGSLARRVTGFSRASKTATTGMWDGAREVERGQPPPAAPPTRPADALGPAEQNANHDTGSRTWPNVPYHRASRKHRVRLTPARRSPRLSTRPHGDLRVIPAAAPEWCNIMYVIDYLS